MRLPLNLALAMLCAIPILVCGQDGSDPVDKITNFPSRFLGHINSKAADMDARLTRQTERYLERLSRQEAKLQRRLMKRDSAAAAKLFNVGSINYQQLLARVRGVNVAMPAVPGVGGSTYLPYMDSIKTSLSFLQQDKTGLLSQAGLEPGKVTAALSSVSGLSDKIKLSEQISQLVRQRRAEIQQALASGSSGLSGIMQKNTQAYSQEAYYYSAQVQAYRDEWNDPDKLTKRGLRVLNQSPAYQSFFKSHSELASLFGTPGGDAAAAAQAKVLAGLQTRATVQAQLHGKVEGGGADAGAAVQQKIQQGKTALKNLQQKVLAAGGGSSSMDVPDFKPNTQRVKTFWGRLEYGVNLQSLPSTYVFPATSDLGASLGYRVNDRNTFGIGASYKLGWGKDIGHIALSSQGVGLRSYWDMKIKGSFSATGGFEYNYQTPFSSLQDLKQMHYWTRSGLVGVTKTISLKNRVFSKTKVQLLWDFLSYSQTPRTQAVIFRVGYSF